MPISPAQHRASVGAGQNRRYDRFQKSRENHTEITLNSSTRLVEIRRFGSNISRVVSAYRERNRKLGHVAARQQSPADMAVMLVSQFRVAVLANTLEFISNGVTPTSVSGSEVASISGGDSFNVMPSSITDVLYKAERNISRYDLQVLSSIHALQTSERVAADEESRMQEQADTFVQPRHRSKRQPVSAARRKSELQTTSPSARNSETGKINGPSDHDEVRPLISYSTFEALPEARQISSYGYAINKALDDIINDDFLPEGIHENAYDAKNGHRNLTIATICGKELVNVIFIPGNPGLLISLNDRERPYVKLNNKSKIPENYYENISGDYFTIDTDDQSLVSGRSKDGSHYRVIGRAEGIKYLKEGRWSFVRDFKAAGEFNIVELSKEMAILSSRDGVNRSLDYPGVPSEKAVDEYVEKEIKRMSYFVKDKNGRIFSIKEFEGRAWQHIHAMGVEEGALYKYEAFLENTIAFFYVRSINYYLENIHKDVTLPESTREWALSAHLGEDVLKPFAIGDYTFANMVFLPDEPGSQKGVLINMNGGDKPYVYVSKAQDIPYYYYNNVIDAGGEIYSTRSGDVKPYSVAGRLSKLKWDYAKNFDSKYASPMDIETLSAKLIDDITQSRNEGGDKLTEYAQERPLIPHDSFNSLPKEVRKSSYDYAISRVIDDIVGDDSLPEDIRTKVSHARDGEQSLALVTICGRSMANVFFVRGTPGLLVNLNDRETPYVLVSEKSDIPNNYYKNIVGDFFAMDVRSTSIVGGKRPEDAIFYRKVGRAEGVKYLQERRWSYDNDFEAVGKFNVSSLAEESEVVSSFSTVNKNLDYPGLPDAAIFYRYVEKEIIRISCSTKESNGAIGDVVERERELRQRVEEIGVKTEDLYKYEGLLSDAVTFIYTQAIYARLDLVYRDMSLPAVARERALGALRGDSVLYPVTITGFKFSNMVFLPEGPGLKKGVLINLNGGEKPQVYVEEKKDIPLYYYKNVISKDSAVNSTQLEGISLNIDAAKLAKSSWDLAKNFNTNNTTPMNADEISERLAEDAGKRPAVWANRFDSEKPLISHNKFELLPKGMQASSYSYAIHRSLDEIINDKSLPQDMRTRASNAKNNHQNLASITICGNRMANLFFIPGNPGLLVSLNDRITPYVLVSESSDIPVGYYENIVGDYFRKEAWGQGRVVSGKPKDTYRITQTGRIVTHQKIDRKKALKDLKEGRWNYAGDFKIGEGYDINGLSNEMVATGLTDGASKSVDYPGLPDDEVFEKYMDHETSRIGNFIKKTEKVILDIEGLDQYIDKRIVLRGLDPNRQVVVFIKDSLRHPLRHPKKRPKRANKLRVRYRDFITGRAQAALAKYRYDNREFDEYPLSEEERSFLYIKDNIFSDYKKYLSEIEKKHAGNVDAYFRLSARLSGGKPNTLAELLDEIRLKAESEIVTNRQLNINFVSSHIYELVSVPGLDIFLPLKPVASLALITSTKFVVNRVLLAHSTSESDSVKYDLRTKHDLINDISLSAMGVLRSLTGRRHAIWRAGAHLPIDIRGAAQQDSRL